MIESAAWYIKTVQNYCVLTQDKRAGQLAKLLPWQKELFRSVKKSRITWLELPRKNGKSATLSFFAIAHLLEGFKNNSNPEVIIAAATRDQAHILFKYVKDQILLNPVLKRALVPLRYEIRLRGKPGFLKTITSDGDSNHGLNPSLILADEIHAWTETGGPGLWEALTTSMGARPTSKMLAITTAGGQYSFAHGLHNYAERVLSGQIKDHTWNPVIYCADDTQPWDDEKLWKKVNPSIDVAVTMDYLRGIAIKARHDEAALLSFKKLHLNQWAGSAAPFIDIETWRQLYRSERPADLHNWECKLGVDLANVSDFNAFALIWRNGERYYTEQFYLITQAQLERRVSKLPELVHTWINEGRIEVVPGNVVTNADRLEIITRLVEANEVEQILFDPWNAHEVSEKLTDKYGDTMTLAVRQGAAYISEPMKLLYRLAQTRDIQHDGNEVTTWMVGNTKLERDKNENWTYNRAKVTEKIDGVAALVTGLAGFVHDQDGQDELAENDIFII